MLAQGLLEGFYLTQVFATVNQYRMTSETNQSKREARAKQTAEVFTPPRLVKQMLDKLPKEVWRKGKTFIDPACGNGNFLVAVLWRKISRNHKILDALQSIYGVDIMRDNIQECRLRLLKLVSIYEPINEQHIRAVFTNIVFVDPSKHTGGSLDYDYAFNGSNIKQENIDRWIGWVENGKLSEVDLPVDDEKCPMRDGSYMIDFGS